MYQGEETAKKAWDALMLIPTYSQPSIASTRMVIEDDFGQRLCLHDFNGVLLENLSETKLGHTEFAMHEAKTRAGIMTRMNSDPVLKQAQLNGGPAMLQPMPPMMR